ncbi:CapA family protein [Amycolatopsis taiwanensis]|uniref:CapA family protein n=1 Tax=Amycolatopsis taiwanensis TaxID=342230 RepID=UPI0004ACB4F5|nr:CapA family protein [Amycolatopsis taiwanensis]
MVTVLLCGDVMLGRGVDQILPHPGDPALVERFVTDARVYVKLAEQANGPIPRPADFAWPWGEALRLLDELAPDVRVLNLETGITADGEFDRGKAVHYRMSPGNVGCLSAVRPDVCVLANNHVLDFGSAGLTDTLCVLSAAGLRGTGAGHDAAEAVRPAVAEVQSGRRVVVAAAGMESAGVPADWAARPDRPGIAFLPDLSDRSADELADRVQAVKGRGDIGIASLHWGPNWGYDVGASEVRFAHRLVERGVDIVYGHSSHHPRPIEVYRGRLVLYGCGDTVDDYEGIRGYEEYRDDLRLLYFATLDAGELISLRMAPMRARNLRLEHAPGADAEWLRATVDHISRRFSTRVERDADGLLTAHPR